MAVMVPDTIRAGTVSSGERYLFNRFRRELPGNCVVMHSLGLTTHKNKLWGECDFVVLAPNGINVIEVKSGGVSCESGQWIFTNRYGKKFKKPEGPFEQASSAMYAVKELVEKNRKLRGLLYGYGVIMPDEEFTQEGAEIDLNVLLEKSGYKENLGDFIEHLGRYWFEVYREKHKKLPQRPSNRDLENIRQILRPDINTAFTLNSMLSSLEQEQVELTEEQSRILQRLDNNSRTIVNGGAGTGKTILAVDKAMRLARQGKRTLYLCYNRLLGDHVQLFIEKADNNSKFEAWSIHNWFNNVIAKANHKPFVKTNELYDESFYEEMFVQKYLEAIIEIDMEPFDVVIIDEGQDIMKEEYFEAIDLTIKGGLDQGSWHIFIDRLQNIFHAEPDDILKRLNDYGTVHYSLNVNCRNTLEIAIATATFSGVDSILEGALEGGYREDVFCSTTKTLLYKLEKRITNILSEGVGKSDIILLSRFRLENSCLSGIDKLVNYKINDLTKTRSVKKNSIDFCTIHAFKGLERRVVFVLDVQDLLDEQSKYLHYCGLSRARSFLTVFIKEEEKTSHEQLAMEFGRRMAKIS